MKTLNRLHRLTRNCWQSLSQDNQECLYWMSVLACVLFIASELTDLYIFAVGGFKP